MQELDQEDIQNLKVVEAESPMNAAIRLTFDTCEVTNLYKAAARTAKINTKKAQILKNGVRTSK